MPRLSVLCCFAIVLTACSSFTIGETDVLYPKSSVTPQTFDVDGVTLTNRFIPVAESLQVNAWHLKKPEARVTVLFFGGNGFYLVQSRGYLRALTRPPANAVLWDYRGYGRSDGTPSVETLRRDALAVYDHLVRQDSISSDRLLVWGHSLGSFLATHVATRREVGGVILENPATTAEDWVSHLIPWYIRLFVGVDVASALRSEDNLDRVRQLDVPLLVVAGSDDNVTDPEMARRLYDHAEVPVKDLIVVEEGDHNGLYDAPRVQRAYRGIIEHVLTPSGTDALPEEAP